MNQINGPEQPTDALKKIKDAEEKAQKTIQAAREKESVEIIQEARDKSATIKQKYIADAKKKAEKANLAILKKAETEVQTIKTNTESLTQSLHEKAKPNMSEAVDLIVKEIEKHMRSKKV